MAIFLSMPWLALVPGIAIAVVALFSHRGGFASGMPLKIQYATALLWIAYAGWEVYCQSISANIRIDLLVIYPILFFASLISIIVWVIDLVRLKKAKH